MVYASSDFGLSYWLEWAAIPVVVWLLARYVAPPLKRLMDERRATIREQLEAGEKSRQEAELLISERRAALERAKSDAETIVAQANRNAERLVSEGHTRAEEEYEHALRRAEVAIELAVGQVRDEVIARIGAAVVQAATKVIAAELDNASHHRLIGEAISAAETESAS